MKKNIRNVIEKILKYKIFLFFKTYIRIFKKCIYKFYILVISVMLVFSGVKIFLLEFVRCFERINMFLSSIFFWVFWVYVYFNRFLR